MNALLKAALLLAGKGKRVFPCQPQGKEPITPHGFKDATTEPAVINGWWSNTPEANLAIATGTDSGLVVLDVDVDAECGKNGEATLAQLEQGHGKLPATLEARTPRGGRHLYFRHPGNATRIPCSTDRLGKGLDVRADGGYVLVAPSQTSRGEYRWLNHAEIADLNGWLLRAMTQRTVNPFGGDGQNPR